MNVAKIEFLTFKVTFKHNILHWSPLTVRAAQTVCTASSTLSSSKALFSSSAILCQSQKGHLCLDTEHVILGYAVNESLLPLCM